jgi:hypothetical protein
MNKFELLSLNAAGLAINNAYSLFKTTIEISIPFQPYLGAIENATLAQFVTDNDHFGKQMNKSQKSDKTNNMNLLDKERIGFWREVKHIESLYLKSPDANKKSVALVLSSFIDSYKDAESLPFNSRSGIFSEIMLKYRSKPELVQAATMLGADSSFAMLEAKNIACDALYKARNDEYAKAEASGTSLKPAAVASYNQFCTAIEQAANFTPTLEIILLFNNLNELRKKYHALGGNGKDVPPTPETPAK